MKPNNLVSLTIAYDALWDFLASQDFSHLKSVWSGRTLWISKWQWKSTHQLELPRYEYDALLKISHTCGHNLIANSSVTDLSALSRLRMEFGTKGRIQLLGTPVERNCGGKAKLVYAGAYKSVHISFIASGLSLTVWILLSDESNISLRPSWAENLIGSPSDEVAWSFMNARKELHVEYFGKTAHAGGNLAWMGYGIRADDFMELLRSKN